VASFILAKMQKTTCLALQSREEEGKSGVGRATAFLQQETFS